MELITNYLVYRLRYLQSYKLLAEQLDDTECFSRDFYRVGHVLIDHPWAIDNLIDCPSIFGIFLKHASEQVLQLLARTEPFGFPVSF